MTVQQFIDNTLRRLTKDYGTLVQDTFDGDGSTKAFRLSRRPILESSYTVKISDVVKTEGTDYTLDKDTGMLEFTSAPADADDNISIDYEHVKLRDNDWIEAINSGIRHFRKKIFQEATDTTSVDMVVDQVDYDLATLIDSEIFEVVSVEFQNSSSDDWQDLTTYYGSNWTWQEKQQNLAINPAPNNTYSLKIRHLKGYSEVSATTDTLPIGDDYLNIYRYWALGEFYETFAASAVTQTKAVSREETFERMRDITALAEHYKNQAEKEAARTRPKKPPKLIKNVKEGKTT